MKKVTDKKSGANLSHKIEEKNKKWRIWLIVVLSQWNVWQFMKTIKVGNSGRNMFCRLLKGAIREAVDNVLLIFFIEKYHFIMWKSHNALQLSRDIWHRTYSISRLEAYILVKIA